MHRRLRRYDVTRWAHDFLSTLMGMRELQDRIDAKVAVAASPAKEIMSRATTPSRRRLLFLDYDGTLTPLVRSPGSGESRTRRDWIC